MSHLAARERSGMKARQSKFSIGRAPSGRARCRTCKNPIGKGDIRIVALAAVSSWPMPRRSVKLVRHTRCVTKSFAAAVLEAHGTVENVPVIGGVSPEEVACAREALMRATAAA